MSKWVVQVERLAGLGQMALAEWVWVESPEMDSAADLQGEQEACLLPQDCSHCLASAELPHSLDCRHPWVEIGFHPRAFHPWSLCCLQLQLPLAQFHPGHHYHRGARVGRALVWEVGWVRWAVAQALAGLLTLNVLAYYK